MADVLPIVGTVFGIVATGIGIANALWPRAPAAAQRETAIPPPPRSATVPDAELEALRGRVTAIEDKIEAADLRAQTFRERVLTKLARIFERLKIKEEDDAGRGSV